MQHQRLHGNRHACAGTTTTCIAHRHRVRRRCARSRNRIGNSGVAQPGRRTPTIICTACGYKLCATAFADAHIAARISYNEAGDAYRHTPLHRAGAIRADRHRVGGRCDRGCYRIGNCSIVQACGRTPAIACTTCGHKLRAAAHAYRYITADSCHRSIQHRNRHARRTATAIAIHNRERVHCCCFRRGYRVGNMCVAQPGRRTPQERYTSHRREPITQKLRTAAGADRCRTADRSTHRWVHGDTHAGTHRATTVLVRHHHAVAAAGRSTDALRRGSIAPQILHTGRLCS